ncbi:MAG: 2-succinyl-5-enolpyruvyl-6-hydroxy-3-cyclohexene-1-carboxylic-acid synthase [Cyclobacteriaceae bacterium]
MDQSVFDTSEVCYQQGVRHAVFSPGSRNAALSISFNRNTKINTRVILDERSAGFIALGIAQETKRPVVLCCTSGSALLNYGPAIAEAYYQRIPLVVLSADRPPEWIDQWDGQTIRQQNPFAQHILSFQQVAVDRSHPDAAWEYRRKISQSALLASGKSGPVHVNIPFREPFYPKQTDSWSFSTISPLKYLHETTHPELPIDLLSEWTVKEKKIIVLGQGQLTKNDRLLLSRLSLEKGIPIINEVTGNGHAISNVIHHQDLFLLNATNWDELSPDLVVTIGLSTISKNLKMLLRQGNFRHWHVSEANELPGDTFQKLSVSIGSSTMAFLNAMIELPEQKTGYQELWKKHQRKAEIALEGLATTKYSEFGCFRRVLQDIPDEAILHLSNSMPVRYANLLGATKPNQLVYCNRGTSGIDGSNSTAVGQAFSTERLVVLLTGDLSFLYDRNAFLHEYDLSNLRVIVFNNFGGGIFDLIQGPRQLETSEREKLFTTPHHKDLKNSAADAGMLYYKANDEVTLELALNDFFERSDLPKLLEIQTVHKTNLEVYNQIKKSIQK